VPASNCRVGNYKDIVPTDPTPASIGVWDHAGPGTNRRNDGDLSRRDQIEWPQRNLLHGWENDGQGQSANWKSYHQPILSAERSKLKQVGGGILHLSLH
jgi:hypothetical protein